MSSIRNCSLTFGDAEKAARRIAFSCMAKPVGSACNLDCGYCYYLDKRFIYNDIHSRMPDGILERYVCQYIEANEVPEVTFVWHGGEPLLAGIDFYRRAICFQRKYRGNKEIHNVLQTNGTLLNPEWCAFFRENDFLIGVSIDGPEDIHDAFRVDKGGQPTFRKVLKNIEMMSAHGVEFNTLSTINKKNEGRGAEVYRFLKSIGSRYMQFLPVMEYVADTEVDVSPNYVIAGCDRSAEEVRNIYAAKNTCAAQDMRRRLIVPPGLPGSRQAEWSVSSEGFGRFMNDVFDAWVTADVGQYYVQLFDAALAQWVGVPAALCSFGETCGDALVVEHNGDVYSCDHYVYPEYRLGNIAENDLADLLTSGRQFRFGIDKRNSLPSECLRCKWYFACRGGCPKHRFDTSSGSGRNLDGLKTQNINALCHGYRMFFSHIEPYMQVMAELLEEELPPAMIIPWARQRMGLR